MVSKKKKKKRIHHLCEDEIVKPIPRDHLLSALGKPRDANGDPRGGFFYPTPTLMIDSYNLSFGPRREKTCPRRFANNTGTSQPAHPRSLISAFVIPFLERIICKRATGEISVF